MPLRKLLRKLGVKIKPKPRPPVQAQIESWPDASKTEMMWGKNQTGKLVSIVDYRHKNMAYPEEGKRGKFSYVIHTHPTHGRPAIKRADAPTRRDFFTHLSGVKRQPKLRAEVISVIDEQGKEIGRIHYKRTGKRTIGAIGSDLELEERLGGPDMDNLPFTSIEFWEMVKEHKIKIRFVPRKGYEWSDRYHSFVEAK